MTRTKYYFDTVGSLRNTDRFWQQDVDGNSFYLAADVDARIAELEQQLATARESFDRAETERIEWVQRGERAEQQLATARQAVWIEAAKKCHECLEMTKADKETWGNPDLNEMLHGRCQAHANFESYCREQAQKGQP